MQFFKEKSIQNKFQILREKTQQETARFYKNQVKFVNVHIKWIVLPFQNHILKKKKQNALK